MFQHFGLLPWKTVYDNAAFGLAMAHAPAARIKERVGHYLDLVGLAGFERHYPYQLSGGMQQRVGLVRALAINPSILLMDEPFAALDAQTREVLQEELLRIMQRPDERKTMVFITHSIDEAILLGDRIAVMSARPGRIKEILDVPFGRPRDVDALRADPRFAELRAHIWHELQRRRRARRPPDGDADRHRRSRSTRPGPSACARAKSRPRRASAAAPCRCSRSASSRSPSCWRSGRCSAPASIRCCSRRRSRSRKAAVGMIGSGELWTYLWPSLDRASRSG